MAQNLPRGRVESCYARPKVQDEVVVRGDLLRPGLKALDTGKAEPRCNDGVVVVHELVRCCGGRRGGRGAFIVLGVGGGRGVLMEGLVNVFPLSLIR